MRRHFPIENMAESWHEGQSGPLTLDELAALFGFAPEDVLVNRMGRLSPHQRQDVVFLSIGHLVRGLVVLVGCGILLAAVAPEARNGWRRGLMAFAFLLALLLAALWIMAAWRVWHPPVKRVTGTIRREGTLQRPVVEIDTLTLRLATRRWKRLPATLPGIYCVYYGPNGRLLSVEPAHEENER